MASTPEWVSECVAYWSERIYEGDIGVDWADACGRCWRCGAERKLQKCHIVAKQFGGELTASNTIPLCSHCHDEMPDVTDPSAVWAWVKHTRPKYFYGSLRAERAFDLAVAQGANLSCFDEKRFVQACNQVGVHFYQHGQGPGVKPSSYAWAIIEACKGG